MCKSSKSSNCDYFYNNRLNWQNVATIPTAAVYEEPNRGASGGKAPPPPPPGYSGARQNKYYDDPDAWMYCEPDE